MNLKIKFKAPYGEVGKKVFNHECEASDNQRATYLKYNKTLLIAPYGIHPKMISDYESEVRNKPPENSPIVDHQVLQKLFDLIVPEEMISGGYLKYDSKNKKYTFEKGPEYFKTDSNPRQTEDAVNNYFFKNKP